MLNKREYRLNIQGYYSDDVRSRFPHSPGIYFVYRGVFVPHLKTVTLRELLYIGETEDFSYTTRLSYIGLCRLKSNRVHVAKPLFLFFLKSKKFTNKKV